MQWFENGIVLSTRCPVPCFDF